MNRRNKTQVILAIGFALSCAFVPRSAQAMDKVDDAQLAKQAGASSYYSGTCDTTNGRYNFKYADGQCHFGAAGPTTGYQGDDYQDTIYASPFCTGSPVNYRTNCYPHQQLYNTVVRSFFVRTWGLRCGMGERRNATQPQCQRRGCV